MAIFANRRQSDGTHIISGGHSSNNARGQGAYPFGKPTLPDSLWLDLSAEEGTLYSGTDRVYKLKGSATNTDFDSILVYLNGLALEKNEYEIDFELETIRFKRFIKPSDDSIEVRSKEDANFAVVDDVLILQVTPGLIEYEDLTYYAPSYGDAINLSRVSGLHKNITNVAFMKEVRNTKQTAYVLSHRIYHDGIYASIKVRGV